MSTFELKATGYYAEFVAYPFVVLGLCLVPFITQQPVNPLTWLGALAAGLFLWTLAEYWIHRFVLHHVAYFRDLHGLHHTSPTALIGTPLWVSFGLLALVVYLPSWWAFGANLGSAFSAGLTIGYIAYGFTHHILHRWKMTPGTLLYRLKHEHALHHFRHDDGNYGVTSPLWDYVFGTAIKTARRKTDR